MKKDVFTFIKEHNHINYCECLIDKAGLVEYASPSHVKALMNSTGMTEQEIWDLMPITESPIHWLINYTGCIAVYTNGCICPSVLTKEQENTLNALITNGLTGRNFASANPFIL